MLLFIERSFVAVVKMVGFPVGLEDFNGREFSVVGADDGFKDGCVWGFKELKSGFRQFGGLAGTH